MTFIYPLGLLGLIGIPIFIIIYIIKNKYTEQTITSTYLWTLSEKFLKHKKPISKLRGLIILIIQCLIVLVASLLIAHPVFIIKNAASDYCYILDGSGSMNIENNDKTRFDTAKEKIEEMILSSADGSKYTLIYYGNATRVVYEKISNKNKAVELLNNLNCAYLSNTCVDALKYAQSYFNENTSTITYLLTDKAYQTTNINLVNVSANEVNYAIKDASYQIVAARYDNAGNLLSPAKTTVFTKVVSYTTDSTIDVCLYADQKLVEKKSVVANALVDTEVEFEYANDTFDSLDIKIETNDALALDNNYTIYNLEREHMYKALIVSNNPFYLESIVKAFGVSTIDVKDSTEYRDTMRGYGLYIFDSFTPVTLPSDGTVWLFNQVGSVSETGFSYKDTIDLSNGAKIELAKGSSTLYKKLCGGLLDLEMHVKKFNTYGQYKNFTTLMTCENEPVIFAGENNYGNREIVFAFDLHETDLPLTYNFLKLFSNLLNYSFPTIIEESNYACGDKIPVNVLPGCKSIRVEAPSGNVNYLETNVATSNYVAQEIGSYKVTVMLEDEAKVFNLYVSYPEVENVSDEGLVVSLSGTQTNDYSDGTYDNLIILFILIGLLFVADWWVYCYEQYQLQ